MKRAPNWTIEEFNFLLNNPQLNSSELTEKLPGRTEDAIQIVRNGIHSWHLGLNISMLSKMMVSRLEKGEFLCPICQERIEL